MHVHAYHVHHCHSDHAFSISCQLKQRRVSGPKMQSMSVYCVYYVHYVHCVHAYVHASIYDITKIACTASYHVTRTSVRLLSRSLAFISPYKIAARSINYVHFHEISCEKSTSLEDIHCSNSVLWTKMDF